MSSTTYKRGTQFGGDDGFEIQHGCQVRYSAAIDEDSTLTWKRGWILELKSTGKLDRDSSATNGLVKLVATERRKPIGGRPDEDETFGSKRAGGVLDPGVFKTGAVASGVEIDINQKVYANGAGLFTNVSAGPVLGKALNTGVIGDGGDGAASLLLWYVNDSYQT